MFLRGITLSITALTALGMLAGTVMADQRKPPRRIIIEDDYYPGPAFIRVIPGVRIFFGDYALTEEEFDELYGSPRRAYREDEEYLPEKPRRKATGREQQAPKQQKKKTAAKPVAEESAPKAPDSKTATGKTAATTGLTCEKASSVVSGYGFSGVTASSCSGKVYAFNAVRDGKSFAIKLDPKSGELTEVKKLP